MRLRKWKWKLIYEKSLLFKRKGTKKKPGFLNSGAIKVLFVNLHPVTKVSRRTRVYSRRLTSGLRISGPFSGFVVFRE